MPTPEEHARQTIDRLLEAAGWVVQDRAALNLGAGPGVTVREFPLTSGYADYLLFIDRKMAGVIEAKPEGTPLSGVEQQSAKYSTGLPERLPAWRKPLPFLYESTGIETYFTDLRDPAPRARRVFAFHKPETLRCWLDESSSLRKRLQTLPPLISNGLWPAQAEAVTNLEHSLAEDKPRSLIQMATGSGKTVTAISFIYRLIKHAGASRVLFLVDRSNLGRQTLKEFQQYVTPDDGRKFTELYSVQHLSSNAIDSHCRVYITTIQRLYSILSGESDFDPSNEERSLFEIGVPQTEPPRTVGYNSGLPPEFFDFIVTDECHRSIYHLWRQVLEYFDSHLIGLTATPSKQTLGFFNQNLVMEYSRERAVIDGVNVDGQVYQIRTAITESGSTVKAGFYVDRRDRLTRRVRWEQLDEELQYGANELDRAVVSDSQIRTVIRAFRDSIFTELYPERAREKPEEQIVPKTLIFAKDDSHAEDIVRIVREEFGKGNDFCQKITYRVTEQAPETLITSFRNSYNPRIAVTVDMIATGTDIKPLEILLFMRLVKSRVQFEQMLGRGTRVINPSDLQAVTSNADRKDRFIIVDAVGTVEQAKVDTQTLERKRSVSFEKLVEQVAFGARDDDTLSSLAGRLARIEREIGAPDRQAIADASGGKTPGQLAAAILDALDPDRWVEAARTATGSDDPTPVQVKQARADLVAQAVSPFDNPTFRGLLVDVQKRNEQTIDTVSPDWVTLAGFDEKATDQAKRTVESFRKFIEEHRDEIDALQLLYSRPYGQRSVTFEQIQSLAARLEAPPNGWTAERLWTAYAKLERDRVHGVNEKRVLTDLVSLVRHALESEPELVPYPERVHERYERWLAAQEASGRQFTPEQRWWLDRIAEHIGVNLSVSIEDLDYGDFHAKGGRLAASRAFGPKLTELLSHISQILAA